MQTYETSQHLIHDAVQEAMPWAVQLYVNNTIPRPAQLETLCSQLLAVLVASEPKTIETVDGEQQGSSSILQQAELPAPSDGRRDAHRLEIHRIRLPHIE